MGLCIENNKTNEHQMIWISASNICSYAVEENVTYYTQECMLTKYIYYYYTVT